MGRQRAPERQEKHGQDDDVSDRIGEPDQLGQKAGLGLVVDLAQAYRPAHEEERQGHHRPIQQSSGTRGAARGRHRKRQHAGDG